MLPNPGPSTSNNLCDDDIQIIDDYPSVRNIPSEPSLIAPIRQTASIFKQPVTIIRNRECIVKTDLKIGVQEKPRPRYWEKALENLSPTYPTGEAVVQINLATTRLRTIGPRVSDQTAVHSMATAMHLSVVPLLGQNIAAPKFISNPCLYLNPDQPLIQELLITDDDIRKQEDRVMLARSRVKDVLDMDKN